MNLRVVKWTCDRCGCKVEVGVNEPQPIGWVGLTLFYPPESSEPNDNYGNGPVGRKHLCGACRSAYNRWLHAARDEVQAEREPVEATS